MVTNLVQEGQEVRLRGLYEQPKGVHLVEQSDSNKACRGDSHEPGWHLVSSRARHC
jgi:hypothetical protein